MSQSIKKFSINFLFTLSANIIQMIFNLVMFFIMPKFLDTTQYGFWQLFQMYALYIGYLTLGITDGIYLRYGGEEYHDLPKDRMASQFSATALLHVVFTCIVSGMVFIAKPDANFTFVIFTTLAAGIFYVPKTMLTFTMQATNRIKSYSFLIIVERITILIFVLLFIVWGKRGFEYFVLADVLGKLINLVLAIWLCRDIVFKRFSLNVFKQESWDNIVVGIKVLIANLSSILINGVVRLFIERRWGIEVFGQISFSFTISNLITTTILAISIVFFPMLKRMNRETSIKVYQLIRSSLALPLSFLLLLYYPMAYLLGLWIPEYQQSIRFLGILFPLILFESNMRLLINNYLKAYRQEKFLMRNNVLAVAFSVIYCLFAVYYVQNLTLAVFGILITYLFKITTAERFVEKYLGISIKSELVLDCILCTIFILTSWFMPLMYGGISFAFSILILFIIKRSVIKKLYVMLKNRKGAA